ncbi:molecular chaperone [Kluyvera genomosp. 1]|uniref:fimbrial biogenesis chaperone n=1 Tax=Kluyvera genomosp. 1 TaxID=2774053 RepID=UPI00068D940E|nr:molecular chaperone [Kluyvera genomosp. 1]
MNFLSKSLIAGVTVLSGLMTAQAGIVIGGTRVIYDGSKKETSISVTNPDSTPYLIQSWVDMPGGTKKAPFIVTPPLYRLDKGQQNVERIVMAGGLPQDKESLYWLNIKSIPASERKSNTLQIAIKSRMKLIYRPATLADISQDELYELANKLTWQRVGNQLQVNNSSKYIFNFNEISVGGKKIENVTFVMPESSERFDLPAGASGGNISFKTIGDFGGVSAAHSAHF